MSIGEIPYGTYEVEIGESFAPVQRRRSHTASSPPDGNFHTLKYDFKPKSVASEQETYISIAENRDVEVVVPNEGLDHITVYKGSKKPIKGDKECILIFDHNTRQCRLEKLSSNISVKKTRDNNVEDEDAIKEKIRQMRLFKSDRQANGGDATVSGLTNGTSKSAASNPQHSPSKSHQSPGRVAGGERTTSFSGILAEEAATSPSAHSSGSSSSGSSSDSSSSSSSDEDDEIADDKRRRKESGRESNSDDDEHVQAIEKIMSEASQPPPPIVQKPPLNDRDGHQTNVVLNDLYMSDDNPSGSESD